MLTIVVLALITTLFVGLFLGSKYQKWFGKGKPLPLSVRSNVIVDQIENVFKVITLESHVGHVYKFEDFKKILVFDQSKRQLIIVNAKVALSFDITKVRVKADQFRKKITITDFPEPEIIVDPDYEFYFTEDSMTNRFSDEERTQILREAKNKIVDRVRDSKLISMSKRQAIEMMNSILRLNDMRDWKIELPKSMQVKLLDQPKGDNKE